MSDTDPHPDPQAPAFGRRLERVAQQAIERLLHEIRIHFDHGFGGPRRTLDGDAALPTTRLVEVQHGFQQGIGPAACLTGSWWEADRMDFASVSVAVARLQVAVCELSPEFLLNARPVSGAPKRLLQVNPGCQHTLGSLMAAEFFRLGGWAVQVAQSLEPAEWVDSIASDWFDVVGLGLAIEAQLPALQAALPRLRSASANPGIKVMLGGPLLQQRPELVRALGADFSASSADEAVALADRWVALGI